MKTKIFLAIAIATFALSSCSEQNNLHPWGKDILKGDLGVVSVTSVESIPGGAIINYSLPQSSDILYVKALYTAGNNQPMEARASKYDHSLRVEGFGDVTPQNIEIYCVDKMENRGEKITTEVVPLTPPVQTVSQSISLGAAFGGIYVDFENQDKANIAIHVETLDESNNTFEPYVHYTSMEQGRFFVRGLSDKTRPFTIYVTDRWGNNGPRKTEEYTPYFEERLDKAKFAIYKLATDINCDAWQGSLANAWNDDFTPERFVHSPGGDTFPLCFTFDIGITTKLSRYTLYHLFRKDLAFQRGNIKRWEVQGRTDAPPRDGSDEQGWTTLLQCNSSKPSGLPIGEISGEDWEYLQNGEQFDFNPDSPSVRYIRFKVYETWGGDDFLHFTEFTFFGNPE